MLEFWRNHVYGEVKAAAAAAKLLQSCPILCDPIDSSPPGYPVPGILQARMLEWVAMSFSNGKSQKLEAIKSKIPWCKWDPKAQILKRGIRCRVDTMNLEHPLCQRESKKRIPKVRNSDSTEKRCWPKNVWFSREEISVSAAQVFHPKQSSYSCTFWWLLSPTALLPPSSPSVASSLDAS